MAAKTSAQVHWEEPNAEAQGRETPFYLGVFSPIVVGNGDAVLYLISQVRPKSTHLGVVLLKDALGPPQTSSTNHIS